MHHRFLELFAWFSGTSLSDGWLAPFLLHDLVFEFITFCDLIFIPLNILLRGNQLKVGTFSWHGDAWLLGPQGAVLSLDIRTFWAMHPRFVFYIGH